MMRRGRGLAFGAASWAVTGCIAPIQEQRSVGAPWPAPDAHRETIEEHRETGPVVRASATGTTVEVTVVQETECRTVTVTDRMLREVSTRRSFADEGPLDLDAAATLLLLAAAGFALYDEDALACNPKDPPGCRDRASSAVQPVAAAAAVLALIPLGFAVYNVARVKDDRRVEGAPPATEVGPWSPCKARPLPTERVQVVLGDRELAATTGADGRVRIDLSSVVAAGAEATAIVKHAGSPDVSVALGGASKHPPP